MYIKWTLSNYFPSSIVSLIINRFVNVRELYSIICLKLRYFYQKKNKVDGLHSSMFTDIRKGHSVWKF